MINNQGMLICPICEKPVKHPVNMCYHFWCLTKFKWSYEYMFFGFWGLSAYRESADRNNILRRK